MLSLWLIDDITSLGYLILQKYININTWRQTLAV